jgi:hypothetical protein
MEDLLSTPNFEENMFAEQGSNLPTEIDPITQQIFIQRTVIITFVYF